MDTAFPAAVSVSAGYRSARRRCAVTEEEIEAGRRRSEQSKSVNIPFEGSEVDSLAAREAFHAVSGCVRMSISPG